MTAPERIWATHGETWGAVELGQWADTVRHKGGETYVHERLYTAQQETIAALVGALEPFAFIDPDNPAEDTQTAWELRYRDRFKDWIDFGDIEQARAALARAKEQA